MQPDASTGGSPCPFCRSGAILLIGGSPTYLYYRCGDCYEIWTVTEHRLPGDRYPIVDGHNAPVVH